MLWKKARPLTSSQVLSARRELVLLVMISFSLTSAGEDFQNRSFCTREAVLLGRLTLHGLVTLLSSPPLPFRCQRRMAAAPSWWPFCIPVPLTWLECRTEGSSRGQAGHCSGTGECKRVTVASLKNFVRYCRCPKPFNERLFTMVIMLLYMQPESKNKSKN